jgi:hypothetical protein
MLEVRPTLEVRLEHVKCESMLEVSATLEVRSTCEVREAQKVPACAMNVND